MTVKDFSDLLKMKAITLSGSNPSEVEEAQYTKISEENGIINVSQQRVIRGKLCEIQGQFKKHPGFSKLQPLNFILTDPSNLPENAKIAVAATANL